MRRLALAGMALLLAAAGPDKEGMPQLNFANPLTTSQVVWGAILFTLLYFAISRWALPKVSSVIAERRTLVATDLDTARTAKSTADAAVAELTEATRRARAEAQAAIASATQQAKAQAASEAAAANEQLERQLAEAEGRINAARNAAMGALKQVASETAVAVVTRLTGANPDPAVIDRAVSAHLPQAANA